MEILHESKFWKFGHDVNDSMMIYQWFNTTELMNDEEYKHEMERNAKECQIYRHPKHLVDLRNFLYTISPEVQAWTDNIIFPRFLDTGLNRIAFVVSQDLFAQVSVEQMLEEDTAVSSFQSRYFDHYFQARDWLTAVK